MDLNQYIGSMILGGGEVWAGKDCIYQNPFRGLLLGGVWGESTFAKWVIRP